MARLLENGDDLHSSENLEGGHGGAANNEQRTQMKAMAFAFLAGQLGLP